MTNPVSTNNGYITINNTALPLNAFGEIVGWLPTEDACALKRTCTVFRDLITSDVSFVKQVMGRNWQVLILANSSLKQNPDLQEIAFNGDAQRQLENGSENSGKGSMPLSNLKLGELCALFTIPFFRKDKEVVLAAVTQNGDALEFAHPQLQNDEKVVLAAVKQNGLKLLTAPQWCRDDKDIVLAAVTQGGWALQYASQRLQDDETVVLAAVSQNGRALRFASPRLQDDIVVVKASVSNFSNVFQGFGDEDMKKGVENAVAFVCNAFEQASPRLQDNQEVILAATAQICLAFQQTSAWGKEDEDLVQTIISDVALAFKGASAKTIASAIQELEHNNSFLRLKN